MITIALPAQRYQYVYRDQQDSSINCYLKVIPHQAEIVGLMVRDFSSLPDTARPSRSQLHLKAAKQGIMTIFTVSSQRFPALYYFDREPALLDEIIHEVINEHQIPDTNIFIGGISASGTRALRFIQYCQQGKSKFNTTVRGAFVVDAPLDLERFYLSAQRHRAYFKKGMLWEANLILEKFPEILGVPQENRARYRAASVFSHTDTTLGHAADFLNTSLIFFHEPDIDWWMPERGATYYDLNSYDMAAFVNKQIHHGHSDLKLITTTKQGFDRQGERNCHSWSIVDEDYLLGWVLQRIHGQSPHE